MAHYGWHSASISRLCGQTLMFPQLSIGRIADRIEDSIFHTISRLHTVIDLRKKSTLPGLQHHADQLVDFHNGTAAHVWGETMQSPCAPSSWTYRWNHSLFPFRTGSGNAYPVRGILGGLLREGQTSGQNPRWSQVLAEGVESLAQVGMYDDWSLSCDLPRFQASQTRLPLRLNWLLCCSWCRAPLVAKIPKLSGHTSAPKPGSNNQDLNLPRPASSLI